MEGALTSPAPTIIDIIDGMILTTGDKANVNETVCCLRFQRNPGLS
jgi:hypothetical protein